MNGLLDFDDPKTLGLLSMGLGLLGSRGRFGEALGQAGLQGINAMQQATQRRADKQFRDAQLEAFKSQADERKLSLEDRRRKAEEEARKRDALGRMLTPGEPMIQPPELGGLPMFSQPQTVTPAAPVRLDPAQMLRMGFSPEEVNQTIAAMNAGRAKVKQTIETEEGGKPVTRMIDEYGQTVGGTMPKYVAPVQVDTGAGIQFVRPEAGSQFSKSMSPAERDAAARGWAANRIANENLGLARQRFDFEKTKPDDKPLTDAQAKAALFGVRMQESDRVLSDLAQQGVTRPGLVKRVAETTAGLVPFAGDKIAPIAGASANWTQSANQQMVEQAQRDFINAVLRRESGAVISPSEFANAEQQYFPQIGDDEKTLQRKAANRQVAIRGILAEVPQSQRGRIVGEISGRQAPAATDDPLGLRGGR